MAQQSTVISLILFLGLITENIGRCSYKYPQWLRWAMLYTSKVTLASRLCKIIMPRLIPQASAYQTKVAFKVVSTDFGICMNQGHPWHTDCRSNFHILAAALHAEEYLTLFFPQTPPNPACCTTSLIIYMYACIHTHTHTHTYIPLSDPGCVCPKGIRSIFRKIIDD